MERDKKGKFLEPYIVIEEDFPELMKILRSKKKVKERNLQTKEISERAYGDRDWNWYCGMVSCRGWKSRFDRYSCQKNLGSSNCKIYKEKR